MKKIIFLILNLIIFLIYGCNPDDSLSESPTSSNNTNSNIFIIDNQVDEDIACNYLLSSTSGTASNKIPKGTRRSYYLVSGA